MTSLIRIYFFLEIKQKMKIQYIKLKYENARINWRAISISCTDGSPGTGGVLVKMFLCSSSVPRPHNVCVRDDWMYMGPLVLLMPHQK
jgi:hypothetical protein